MKHSRLRRVRSLIGLCCCLSFLACESPPPRGTSGVVRGGDFGSLFRMQSRFELQEEESDLIGDIGQFVETRARGMVISDALQPRVWRFDSTGTLLSSFGAFGAGPFEFRGIGGIAQDGLGRTVVTDPQLGRVTVLSQGFQPDTMVRPRPPPRGEAEAMPKGWLLLTSAGSRASGISYFATSSWQSRWSVAAPSPGSFFEFPYWNSVARIHLATYSTGFVAAYSLIYPIYQYDSHGVLLDSLVQPPTTFRRASVPEVGAFAGAGAGERRQNWLTSFDMIAELSILADTLLVVTHGQLGQMPTSPFEATHDRLDIWDLNRKVKIAEDISLPDGARVLGGGSALYLLTNSPPEPWTILRASPEPANWR